MLNRDKAIEALRQVLDPEIGINLVDLNMVRGIAEKNGDVTVTIALTVAHCPLAKTLQADVEKALRQFSEVKTVKVETMAMSKKELEELRMKLQGMARPAQPTKPGSVGTGIERLGKRGIRNIIAVVSGKGGVGKSFVTSMLGSELRRQGYEVGVLDADLTGPSIAKVFGVTERPTKNSAGLITPVKTKTGLKVMSINLVLDDPTTPVIWRGPIVNSVIRQLYWEVDWGDLHYLLVDLPPGTSDAPLTVFQSLPLDGVIVVSSPQDLASLIVKKAVNMARKMDVPLLGLIENMSYLMCPHCNEKISLFGETQGVRLSESLSIPFLGAVPLDPAIAKLSDDGRIEEYRSTTVENVANELRLRATRSVEQLMQGLPIAWAADSTSA